MEKINRWCSDATNQMIPDFISSTNDIDPSTRCSDFICRRAICFTTIAREYRRDEDSRITSFRTDLSKFNPSRTKCQDFHVDGHTTFQLPMMSQDISAVFCESSELGIRLLKLNLTVSGAGLL
ncbi:unnamed protein product [Protopolystoma xenopodis]|uniref:Uncharacterized protein n=1 Tax=Protopolystoma xenopodis TaxID=117903 RepID=A0A448X7I5_9PLAT|nr:unnamed protein product [Protopolystoma xenopodis]